MYNHFKEESIMIQTMSKTFSSYLFNGIPEAANDQIIDEESMLAKAVVFNNTLEEELKKFIDDVVRNNTLAVIIDLTNITDDEKINFIKDISNRDLSKNGYNNADIKESLVYIKSAE